MLRYENGCVDCGLPCIGRACPHRRIPVYYCDECKAEIEGDIYESEGDDLCESCLHRRYRKID